MEGYSGTAYHVVFYKMTLVSVSGGEQGREEKEEEKERKKYKAIE